MIHIAKPFLGDEEKEAVLSVLSSGMIASGDKVLEFEKAFSSYIGLKECIACSSGTTALELALRALGIGPGDKVLTTSYSFIASTNCIIYVGATPVFTDIDPDSFLMSPENIRKALEKHPDIKAVLVVHLFGQACDMEEVQAIAKEKGLLLIEDCAQSHGALYKGKKSGSFGDASCFSFYPTKNMTTSEGGAVLFKDKEVADKCRMLVNHGMKKRYCHEIIGYNYRMTNIAAAIGLEQLKKLPAFNAKRQKNAAWLSGHISNPFIKLPKINSNCEHVFHQYTVKAQGRGSFIRHLEANGVGYGIFYPMSIPEQGCYKHLGFETNYPVADEIKKQVVSLPTHPMLTDGELETIAQVVNSFFE
ncbi:MAG: DegT/DnrJ/EryC1/StrS family aminotransferase [Clostridiales bacterium]|jgi:perosamine synthetase|nr:DegT/DnrJ/EryC1/StrS family aminotransferase [Clostridiales bacterium]